MKAPDHDEPPVKSNTGLKRIFKAFFYSVDGIVATLRYEAAFRQEVLLALVLVPLSFLVAADVAQHLLLIGSLVVLLIVELLNSAVETVVDDISPSNRPLARRAKDMGSAAVFLSLVFCGICWGSVLWINWDRLFQ